MKSEYSIHKSTKQMCAPLLYSHHYLTGISRGFKSGHNYGLYNNQNIVGCCIYTGLPVPELAKGMFGLDRDKQEGLFELSRLVLKPEHQEREGVVQDQPIDPKHPLVATQHQTVIVLELIY